MKCSLCFREKRFMVSFGLPAHRIGMQFACLDCIKAINTAAARVIREQGWVLTKDALIVKLETKKESA